MALGVGCMRGHLSNLGYGGNGISDYLNVMHDDPQEISKHLILQHRSIEAALAAAAFGAVDARDNNDLYGLSVWRDVKRILRERAESEEA